MRSGYNTGHRGAVPQKMPIRGQSDGNNPIRKPEVRSALEIYVGGDAGICHGESSAAQSAQGFRGNQSPDWSDLIGDCGEPSLSITEKKPRTGAPGLRSFSHKV
jgi:hypothetical protein